MTQLATSFYYDRNEGRIEYQTLDDGITHITSASQLNTVGGNTATVNRMSIDLGGMGYILTGTTLYSFNSNDSDTQMAMINLGNLTDKMALVKAFSSFKYDPKNSFYVELKNIANPLSTYTRSTNKP